MFRNYFKTAIRGLRKNGLFSAINIFGLALSMSVCLIALVVIKDAFTYDTFHPHAERTYRIITEVTDKDGRNSRWATAPLPLGEQLSRDYPFVEKTARVYSRLSDNASSGPTSLSVEGAFTDPSFFDIFGFELLYGDKKSALLHPYSVVLTQETAGLFFKNGNPVGKTLEFKNLNSVFTVTGVIKNNHRNTHLDQKLFASMSSVPSLEAQKKLELSSGDWQKFDATATYVLTKENTPEKMFSAALSSIAETSAKSHPVKNVAAITYDVQNINDITPGEELINGGNTVSSLVLFAIGGVAFLILLLACFNYTNLSLARSLSRAKEVGIRKIAGGSRAQLFFQFITESVIVSLIALVFSYLVLQVLMMFPLVQQGILKNAKPDGASLFDFVLFAVFAGLLAGVVPAWILSSLRPLQVLKSLTSIKIFRGLGLQKTLIVLQFSVSLVFMIFLASIYRQAKFLTSFSYGFSPENILTVSVPAKEKEVYKSEIEKLAGIEKVAAVSSAFGFYTTHHSSMKKESGEEQTEADVFFIDENVIPLMGVQLMAGANFTRPAASNRNKIIVNEKAANFLGFNSPEEAIGKPSILNDTLRVTIAGVIKDFNYASPKQHLGNLVLQFNPDQSNCLLAKVAAPNKAAITSQIRKTARKINFNAKLTPTWLQDELTDARREPEELSIVAFLAFMAITIACIGLLGIATYTARVRQKEVGVRKVLGAGVSSLVYLLSKEFVHLLLIAGLIALPVGYVLGNSFLDEFAYRVHLGWEILGASLLTVFLLGFATISSQTIKVANANPVKSLRTE